MSYHCVLLAALAGCLWWPGGHQRYWLRIEEGGGLELTAGPPEPVFVPLVGVLRVSPLSLLLQALVVLQLWGNIETLFLDTWQEFGQHVSALTKAIAKHPYK